MFYGVAAWMVWKRMKFHETHKNLIALHSGKYSQPILKRRKKKDWTPAATAKLDNTNVYQDRCSFLLVVTIHILAAAMPCVLIKYLLYFFFFFRCCFPCCKLTMATVKNDGEKPVSAIRREKNCRTSSSHSGAHAHEFVYDIRCVHAERNRHIHNIRKLAEESHSSIYYIFEWSLACDFFYFSLSLCVFYFSFMLLLLLLLMLWHFVVVLNSRSIQCSTQ